MNHLRISHVILLETQQRAVLFIQINAGNRLLLVSQLFDDTALRGGSNLGGSRLVADITDHAGVCTTEGRFAGHQNFGFQVDQLLSVFIIAPPAVSLTGCGNFRWIADRHF